MPPFLLLPLQIVLDRIVAGVASRQPAIFARLGRHAGSVFLIDPLNLPIVLTLSPHPRQPRLRADWRGRHEKTDCRIAGSFLTLLALIDGRGDGDALFFSRHLTVEGDIDAVVSLRNALDDLDVTLVQDIVQSSGPMRMPLEALLQFLRAIGRQQVGHVGRQTYSS
jgi:predicted lipid carrier protein YhbT